MKGENGDEDTIPVLLLTVTDEDTQPLGVHV